MLLERKHGVLMLLGRRTTKSCCCHHTESNAFQAWLQRSIRYALLTFSPKTPLLVAILGARTDSWVFCRHLCLLHDSRHCHVVPSVRAAGMQGASIQSEMTNNHQINFPCFCSTLNAELDTFLDLSSLARMLRPLESWPSLDCRDPWGVCIIITTIINGLGPFRIMTRMHIACANASTIDT